MSGRLEHEQHLRQVAMNKIGNYPKVLRNFYEEFCAKQETSRMDMTYKVKRFWDYLESECGYDFFVQSNWNQVTTRDIKDWVKSIKFKTFKDGRREPKSPRTIWDECKAVKKFFDYLMIEKIIKENPWPTKVELDGIIGETTKEHVVTYMTLYEVDEVSDSIVDKSTEPCRDLCIFILGCRHGLRAQALSEIDVEDIDTINGFMTYKLGHIPEDGEKFETVYGGYHFMILGVENKVVTKKFGSYEDAKDYLIETFEFSRTKLRSKADIQRAFKAKNIELIIDD